MNMQLFTNNFANSFSGSFSFIAISKSALWQTNCSLFLEKCSYGNDPMAYGIISRFW